MICHPWPLKTSKLGHFQKANLNCLTDTSQKWDVSCQSFTSHKSSKFLRILIFSASYAFCGSWKPQKWAIFEMRSSIAWSILVRNEIWVAKVFLHTYFQVFWVIHVVSDMFFSWGHRAKPKFWRTRLYYLANTIQIWAVSSQKFSLHVLPEFWVHTCCFQLSF